MPLVERRSYCTAQSVVCTPLQKESTNKLTISTDILLHLQEAEHYDTRMLAARNVSAWTIYKTSTTAEGNYQTDAASCRVSFLVPIGKLAALLL